MRKWCGVPGLALTFLILTSAAFGQGGATGAPSGVVQDNSGSGVAGARVVVLNESTKEVLRTEKRLVQFALRHAFKLDSANAPPSQSRGETLVSVCEAPEARRKSYVRSTRGLDTITVEK